MGSNKNSWYTTEMKEKKEEEVTKQAIVDTVAGIAVTASGLYTLFSDSGPASNKKKMEAPGKDYYINSESSKKNSSYTAKMKEKKKEKVTEQAIVDTVAGIARAASGLNTLFSDSGPASNKKKMEAPRKDYYIKIESSKKNSSHVAKMKEKTEEEVTEQAMVDTVAGIARAASGLYTLFSDSGPASNEKNMKAPGKDYYINRDDFDHDPAGYFRNNLK